MSTSVIEKKLLNKKITEFNQEIDKGAAIIIDAISKYYNGKSVASSKSGFKGDVTKELTTYISRRLSISTFYSGGYYTIIENRANELHNEEFKMFVPEAIKEALLEEAVSEFFSKFKELGEIAEGL